MSTMYIMRLLSHRENHARTSYLILPQKLTHFTLYTPLSLGLQPYYNMIQFMFLLVSQT
jgi:hypothetical protein